MIVIAGASGYIGKEVIGLLLARFPKAQITALSRVKQSETDERVAWKACDLFSIESLEAAIPKKVDYALYLVHSMGPTAQLDQGSFADYDLILADNFSRAIRHTTLKQLIYLGGLIPENESLSLHLQSRREIEDVFAEHKLPTTVFRAGLILGEAGSSFQILVKLVRRLPIMICPHWTQTLTTPVDLETVMNSIVSAIADLSHIGKVYDLAGCEPLSYIQMMDTTAKKMGLRRTFLGVPFFTPTLSRLWVSLITNTPKNLVYPLIESLEHPMVPRADHLYHQANGKRTYSELIDKISFKTRPGRSLFRFRVQRKTVRSVQRLPLPPGHDSRWVKDQYIEWLPKFLSPIVNVRIEGSRAIFSLFKNKVDLLELCLNQARSSPEQQQMHITRGLLVSQENSGRLEFRVVLRGQSVIAAIHDFRPALPWFIYKYTQAKLHLFVMTSFGRFLKSTAADANKSNCP